jgi:hypothetical protein
MKLVYTIVAALMLWATPSFAADHWQACNLGFEAGTALDSTRLFLRSVLVGGPKSYCYDTNGTADSPMINTESCDQIDVKLFNFTDGAFADLSVIPRACPTDAVDGTACEPIVSDLATATSEEIQGYGGSYIYMDWVTNTNSDNARIMVRCNGG